MWQFKNFGKNEVTVDALGMILISMRIMQIGMSLLVYNLSYGVGSALLVPRCNKAMPDAEELQDE